MDSERQRAAVARKDNHQKRKQQALSHNSTRQMVYGSQQSTTSGSSSQSQSQSQSSRASSQQTIVSCRTTLAPTLTLPSIETPCKQIAELKLNGGGGGSSGKKNKTKKKLLGSKSLSSLMPVKFFRKKSQQQTTSDNPKTSPKLTTTRSFPNGAFNLGEPMAQAPQIGDQQDDSRGQSLSIRQIHSVSLLGMPRQSTCNPLVDYESSSLPSCENLANLSPIAGSQNEMIRNVVASTPTIRMRGSLAARTPSQMNIERKQQQDEMDDTKAGGQAKPSNKYKPAFKNTALVLRDVKNSLGLRMRAKHNSKAFARLTNDELTNTPPTKLYGPFNIYTPGCSPSDDKEWQFENSLCESATGKSCEKKNQRKKKQQQKKEKKLSKSRRLLGLKTNKRTNVVEQQQQQQHANDDSMISAYDDSGFHSSMNSGGHTPKVRIALRHKKHLLQANKFASFQSPTNRLRETVKDVEQFQQCIEDISMAIRARNQQQQLQQLELI